VQFREQQLMTVRGHRDKEAPKLDKLEYGIQALVAPLFPRDRLIPYYELREFCERQFAEHARTHNSVMRLKDITHVDEGICAYVDLNAYQRTLRYFFEFTSYGTCLVSFYVAKFGEPEPNQVYIRVEHTMRIALISLDLCMFFLDKARFRGSRWAQISASNLGNTQIDREIPGCCPFKQSVSCSNKLQTTLSTQSVISSVDNGCEMRNLLVEFVGRLVHLYGAYSESYDCAKALYDIVTKETET